MNIDPEYDNNASKRALPAPWKAIKPLRKPCILPCKVINIPQAIQNASRDNHGLPNVRARACMRLCMPGEHLCVHVLPKLCTLVCTSVRTPVCTGATLSKPMCTAVHIKKRTPVHCGLQGCAHPVHLFRPAHTGVHTSHSRAHRCSHPAMQMNTGVHFLG